MTIKTTNLPKRQHFILKLLYIVTIGITIFLGLASRKYELHFPLFIAENAGDFLWAMMCYFGFRFIFTGKRLLTATCFSFLFSFGIEFSQLYQAHWINEIRATLPGRLILGQGFLAVDLVRYSLGIVVGICLDYFILKYSSKNE